jgi:alpha-beta hydrolase superfamily lysophospholipase
MTSSVLAPFTARDGENLALYEWPLDGWVTEMGEDALPPRGVVLIVHGLGEHATRYDHVANFLMDWGFAVRGYDQRGHGESDGARGVLPTETALIDDLAEIVDDTQLRSRVLMAGMEPKRHASAQSLRLPLILLGHSMGGLVVSRFIAEQVRHVDGVVLSSPALDAGLGPLQKLLLGLDARFISHDQEVVRKYVSDRLVHDRISPRLGKFIAGSGPRSVRAAARWAVPTLLMYAGADRLVNPAGSRAFAENAAGSAAVKPGTVTVKCFDDSYHEIFNEIASEPVFETLKTWLDARF